MIKGLILSIQFFSRIPIKIPVDFNEKNIRYSIFFMPLVGGLIGFFVVFLYYFLSPYNRLIGSFLALLITIILTGGLHIDGLSDSFDGFMSNRDRERTLEIMKDSRIGAFGVLSIVLLLLFKFILIYSLENLPLFLLLSLVNSRLATAYIISSKKSARESGLGKLFYDSKPRNLVLLFSLIYIIIMAITDLSYLLPLLGTFLLGEYISRLSYKKIGGLTGDVYGAIIELGDVISLLGFWGVLLWK